MARRLAYVTFGTDGGGHVVRGLAVASALRDTAADVSVRLFAPDLPAAALADGVADCMRFDPAPAQWRTPALARQSALAAALDAYAPDLVVLDLFWLPWHQLALPFPTWLLLRSVPPAWLVGPAEVRFDAARFERVIAIEPAPGLSRFEPHAPIVWRPRVAATRDALCAAVGARADTPLRLIVRSGLPDDEARLETAAAARGGHWHTTSLWENDCGMFPIAPWLASTTPGDTFIAAPGYNTYWEAAAYGFADRVTWVPCPRRLDDQAWRAALPRAASPAGDGAAVLAAAVAQRLGQPT